jgi:hypothetical protein
MGSVMNLSFWDFGAISTLSEAMPAFVSLREKMILYRGVGICSCRSSHQMQATVHQPSILLLNRSGRRKKKTKSETRQGINIFPLLNHNHIDEKILILRTKNLSVLGLVWFAGYGQGPTRFCLCKFSPSITGSGTLV